MSLGRDEMRSHASSVRDMLKSLVNCEGEEQLNPDRLQNLENMFVGLKSTDVDADRLKFSRLEKALMEMSAPGSKWPQSLVDLALEVVREWQKKLGDISDSGAPLWAPGGRMHSVSKIGGWAENDNQDEESSWQFEGGDDSKAYVTGHNGFQVGHWWIKKACAFRDGAIDSKDEGITCDDSQAYAIVMTDEEEEESPLRPDIISYHADMRDRGRFKLLKNFGCHLPIRVLRSWKLKSQWAPTAGVRYDGLYTIKGYGVKSLEDDGPQGLTFHLARDSDQPGIHRAIVHPNSEEMDDWREYRNIREKFRASTIGIPASGQDEVSTSGQADSSLTTL
ncbi:MAG: hypothetical protein M1819_005937 [Sarea resinae]|nr:MAG: hypothetical protein M1819_005937 [Sarea resinae]